MSNIFQTNLNQQYFGLVTLEMALKMVLEMVPQKVPEWWWQLQILQLQFPWNFKGLCQINFKQGWIRNVFYRWYKKWPQNWDHKMVPKKVPESIVAILDSRASLAQQVGSKTKKILLSSYLFCRLGSRMVLHRFESGTTGFHLSKNTK